MLVVALLFAAVAANPYGDWRGPSTCLVRPSPCHDEDALYRVSRLKEPNRVHLQVHKYVNGEPAMFSEDDCRYDAKRAAIDCALPNGSRVQFDIKGDAMDGNFVEKDGTKYRAMHLRRVPSAH